MSREGARKPVRLLIMSTDRRSFLFAAGSALVGCSGGESPAPEAPESPAAATFDHAIGAQLYTLRSVLPDDPAAVLQGLAEIGYSEVEVLQATYAELRPLVEDAGLKAVSMHLVSQVVTGSWGDGDKPELTTVEEVAEWAAGAGLSYLVMPYLAQNDRGSNLDHYKALAEKLNAAGQAAKAAGLGFAYHNHAFEFEPIEGSTPLKTLMENTDPELVQLELDVFWVGLAGSDPAAVLGEYSGRVPLTHLKDKAASAPTQFNERLPEEAFEEVGDGTLDFPAILRACGAAGVQHYFVEQDRTPGDPLASVRQSYEYLRTVEV